MHNKKENIVIVGAGLTGLALCNLLKGTNTSLSVLDSQPKSFYKKIDSDRNIVLSNTSMLIFKNIGIWEEIKKYCAEVKNIHISKKNIFGSTLVKSSDENLDALGYQIPIKHLIKILYKNIESEENIKFLNEARVINVKQGETVEIKYIQDSYENNIDSKSVIFSTGSTDNLFKDIFLEKVQKDYCQNAVTCEILSEKYNSETAFERFTSRGILGLIPRKENSWTLIYSTDQEESKIIENLNISSTKNYFQKLIGDKCGKFIEVKNIKIYPLKMKYYKDFVNKNLDKNNIEVIYLVSFTEKEIMFDNIKVYFNEKCFNDIFLIENKLSYHEIKNCS